MKKLVAVVLVLAMISCATAFAVSASDFNGTWDTDHLVVSGIELPAKELGFDMVVTALDTELGTIVKVKSSAMGIDAQEIFDLQGDSLVLKNTAHIDYVDAETINLFIEGDADNTYIVLKQTSKPEGAISETPKQEERIPVEVSKSAQGIKTTGTDKIVVSDWAFCKDSFYNKMVIAFTNATNENIPYLNVQVIFYDKDGNIIASQKDGHDAILAGSTVVTCKSIYDDSVSNYDSVELVLEVDDSNDYVNHAENLEIVENVSGNKVFLQVTNNDSVEIEEIEIVVVYYKNGVAVGADEDEIYHMKTGSKEVMEFTGYKDCGADSYKVFINQAHTW